MKIALVGSSGYIAGFLLDRMRNDADVESVLKIGRSEPAGVYLDLQAAEQFDYEALCGVDYVIFTAAISGPDQCAREFERCWTINVTGTGYFIQEALKRGCRVLFFSSDAVFGDVPGKIYDERSETCAQTPYGRMKKAIEDRFCGEENFKAIRLSYVASAQDRFVKYCIQCMDKDETADVFHPFYRNVVTVSDVVSAVIWMVKHWTEFEPPVLNAAGTELVSRIRIADELNRCMSGRLRYTISFPGEDFYQNRPQVTQMRSLYLDAYHIISNESFTLKFQKELEDITK